MIASYQLIYKNEKHCVDEKLNAEERLLYHQENSTTPMYSMIDLCHFMIKSPNYFLLSQMIEQLLIPEHIIPCQPNSELFKSALYILNRKKELTNFLRFAGVPLDTNEVERKVKAIIEIRKKGFFYHTEQSAIFSGFENNEIVEYMIELLNDAPDMNWHKDLIASKVNKEVVQKEVVKRLKFVAPMVKYIEAPIELHDYLMEWHELGSAYVERKYKLHNFDDNYFKDGDENFIIDILSHSDDRSSDLMIKRSDAYNIDKDKIAQEKKEREDILKREFLDVLPAKLQEWLDSMGVPEEHKDELVDEYSLTQRVMAPKVKPRKLMKVGRNDPCTCNSGKKYKKCCGI